MASNSCHPCGWQQSLEHTAGARPAAKFNTLCPSFPSFHQLIIHSPPCTSSRERLNEKALQRNFAMLGNNNINTGEQTHCHWTKPTVTLVVMSRSLTPVRLACPELQVSHNLQKHTFEPRKPKEGPRTEF